MTGGTVKIFKYKFTLSEVRGMYVLQICHTALCLTFEFYFSKSICTLNSRVITTLRNFGVEASRLKKWKEFLWTIALTILTTVQTICFTRENIASVVIMYYKYKLNHINKHNTYNYWVVNGIYSILRSYITCKH